MRKIKYLTPETDGEVADENNDHSASESENEVAILV